MCKVLVYHTERKMCLLLKELLKEYVTKFDEYFNYDRSEFIGLAKRLQPDVVFFQRRYQLQETTSIIHCFKVVWPHCKFIVLAKDDVECQHLKQNLIGYSEDVLDENNMDVQLPIIIDKYITKPTKTPQINDDIVDKLTKTEKIIYKYLVEGIKPRKIATLTGINYETVRKHIQNIYTKADIHNYKNFSD